MRERRTLSVRWQVAGLVLLVAVAVVLSFLAVNRHEPDDAGLVSDTNGASADASQSATPTGSSSSSSASAATPSGVPKVPDQRRADFTKGDPLPKGSQVIDLGTNSSGLVLSAAGLTHGDALEDQQGAGYIETKLDSDVQSLGASVQFPSASAGSLILVAWQSSLRKAVAAGTPFPAYGMRLVANPTGWSLSLYDETEKTDAALASGTYPLTDGAVDFTVVRDGSTLYVEDPSGKVTTASDPRVASLAGPWASWGLTESDPTATPAVIDSVWAG